MSDEDKWQANVRPYWAGTLEPLARQDFDIIYCALTERLGFDGDVITEALRRCGVTPEASEALHETVHAILRSDDPMLRQLSDAQALQAFLACCLASAALGEEELEAITAHDRGDFDRTIRRLYAQLSKSPRFTPKN